MTFLLPHTKHLASRDKILRKVISDFGGEITLSDIVNQFPFDQLTKSIAGQQLSEKAASTIRSRMCSLLGSPISPAAILKSSINELRSCGLSGAKSDYIWNLATVVDSGKLILENLTSLRNEEILAELTGIRGVGTWTAQMFLIFSCGRQDVLATRDAGLRRAIRLIYDIEIDTDEEFELFSEKWKPYRSIASLHLWNYLDNV